MDPCSLDELRSVMRAEGQQFRVPLTLFGDPRSPHGGFESLEQASAWHLLNQPKIEGSVDNSDSAFLRASFGWIICRLEINCWSVLKHFSQFGVSEVVDLAELALRTSGSHAERFQKRLSELFPGGAQTIVYWDEDAKSDFYSLAQAIGHVLRISPGPTQNLNFCETPAGNWLVLCSATPGHAWIVRAALGADRRKCLDWASACAETRSN